MFHEERAKRATGPALLLLEFQPGATFEVTPLLGSIRGKVVPDFVSLFFLESALVKTCLRVVR